MSSYSLPISETLEKFALLSFEDNASEAQKKYIASLPANSFDRMVLEVLQLQKGENTKDSLEKQEKLIEQLSKQFGRQTVNVLVNRMEVLQACLLKQKRKELFNS